VQGDEGLVRRMEIFAPKQQVQLGMSFLAVLRERREKRTTVSMSGSERTEMSKRHHRKKDVIPCVESQSADGEVVSEEIQHDEEEGEQEPEMRQQEKEDE